MIYRSLEQWHENECVLIPQIRTYSLEFGISCLLGNYGRITNFVRWNVGLGNLGRDMKAVWIAAGDGSSYLDAVKSFRAAELNSVISKVAKKELKKLWKLDDAARFIDYLDDLDVGPTSFFFTLWECMRRKQRLPSDNELLESQCVAMIVLIQDWSLGCDGSNSLLINRVGE